jgi:protein phosphatase PTC2/3
MDMDQRTRKLGGRSGRIILLGDGTEVLTDAADIDMFDHDEEDKDLSSQVGRGDSPNHYAQEHEEDDGSVRSEREGTPGPGPSLSSSSLSTPGTSASGDSSDQHAVTESPASTKTEHSSSGTEPPVEEPKMTAASEDVPAEKIAEAAEEK